jgi:two-component sensor histidine kinase
MAETLQTWGDACAKRGGAVLSPEGERIARLFEQAPGFVVFLRGPAHIYEWVNEAHRQAAGGLDVIGKSVIHASPELEPQGLVALLDEAYQSGATRRMTGLKLHIRGASGRAREGYFDFVTQPIRDDDGAVVGLLVQGQDVTERVVAHRALAEREEQLRIAIGAGRMAVCAVDPQTGETESSPELNALLGWPQEARPSGAELRAQFDPDDLEGVRSLVLDAHARGEPFFEAEVRCRRADDQCLRWLLIRGRTAWADTEAGRRLLSVLTDITDRKADEERLLLLAREVDHRANNLLATVQSLVSLTRGTDLPRFREAVLGRISALAQAHRLLAESRWRGASLRRVVDEELRALAVAGRVEVEGEDARLSPAAAQGLALALHELETNALKYGCWSTAHGRLALAWTAPTAGRIVEMTWRETGGPPVSAPQRAGFGTTLLRRALGGGAGGEVDLDWAPEGLRCRLRIPAL